MSPAIPRVGDMIGQTANPVARAWPDIDWYVAHRP